MADAAARYTVTVDGVEGSFTCRADEALLVGMARLGRRGIPVGCRGGGCGICKVQVLTGEFVAGRMSREHVSADDQRERIVLACRIYPRGDLRVRPVDLMQRAIGKGADPASQGQ